MSMTDVRTYLKIPTMDTQKFNMLLDGAMVNVQKATLPDGRMEWRYAEDARARVLTQVARVMERHDEGRLGRRNVHHILATSESGVHLSMRDQHSGRRDRAEWLYYVWQVNRAPRVFIGRSVSAAVYEFTRWSFEPLSPERSS